VFVQTDELNRAKYIAFGTFRRDGKLVNTPVWVVPFRDGYAFTTERGSWKTKRLSHDPRVVITPCNFRGQALPGATTFQGRGEVLEGASVVEARRAIQRKYRRIETLLELRSQFSEKVLRRPKMVECAIYFVLENTT
jgi:PPOX class probable F420-dependent enzyme